MTYQKNFDYTAALKKATDPLEKERLEREKAEKVADIQRAGLDYTKAADIKKFATGSVSAPQSETRTQQYTFNELAAQEAGRIAREAIANGTAEPEPELIEYVDQGGNIQRIRKDQVAYVPKEWKLKGAVNQQDQFSTLAKQLADAQKQKNIAALQQAYDKTFSSLQAEKSGLEPMFGAQTRQAVTQSTMGKKSFSDFLAEKGLGGSGLSGQGEIAQNVALQGELGGIEARKGQAFADVARRITEAQQVRDYGIASAESDVAMLNAQQQLERLKQQEQRDYAEQQASKEEQKQLQQQREQNYAATINPLEDQTAIIQRLKAQGIPDDDYRIVAHQKVRVAKLGQMADREYQTELARIKNEAERQEQAFEIAKWKFEQGLPADSATSTLLGIPVGSVIPSQRIKEAQLQLDKIRASKSSGGGTSASSTTSTGEQITKPVVKTSTLKSQVDKNVNDTIEARELEPKESVVRQLRADEIIKYSNNNQITDAQAKELIATYGLTQADIEQAERRFDLIRGMGGR